MPKNYVWNEEVISSTKERINEFEKQAIFLGECDHPFTSFAEALSGRKLTVFEKANIKRIYQKSYDPYISHYPPAPIFLEESHKIYLSHAYLLGMQNSFHYFDVDCSSFISTYSIAKPNRNHRIYSNNICVPFCYIDDFIKELKSSASWYSLVLSVKNKLEDLQPYKNIVYPWDYEDSKETHRKELKVEGEIKNDIHSKSGRHNRKRCKVV